MRNVILIMLAGLCCTGQVLSQTTRQASSAAPARKDILAARSLAHDAVNMSVCPDARGRAGRMAALCEFAARLVPSDPQINMLLANVCQSQGRRQQAAGAAKVYLEANKQDFSQGMLWLRLELALQDDAAGRVALLKSMADQGNLPASLRAVAAARRAELLLGMAQRPAAAAARKEALELDPYLPEGLRGRLALQEKSTTCLGAETMLALLRGNPSADGVTADLASLLGSVGLHEESLEFLQFTRRLSARRGVSGETAHQLVVRHCNAMLDAGRDKEAIETFQPMLEQLPDSVDLRSLLMEAYQTTGDLAKAKLLAGRIGTLYRPKEVGVSVSAAAARELAMYYLVTSPDADKALRYARQASKANADDPVAQRVLGAAELRSGREGLIKSGKARLAKLMDKDTYAAVFLAEYYYLAGESQAGRRTILGGAGLARGGPAFRRLLRLAREHGLVIPPAEDRREVRKLIDAFDRRYLEMGISPEKFLEVTVTPLSARVVPGEPIEVDLTLTNTAAVDIPIGQWGLLRAATGVTVTVNGRPDKVFADLPLAVWPAPRYLGAGESVRCKARLDVGKLGTMLIRRPLDEISLTVKCMLDPVQRGTTLRSALPSVSVAPATIVRTSLLDRFAQADPTAWPAAYRYILGTIVRDMKDRALSKRLQAARQVGALLALARSVERGTVRPPKPLTGKVTKPVLMTMMREVLTDKSDVVRAEMVAALQHVPLDKRIVSLLASGGVIEDRSALVRLRVAELFGTLGASENRAVLDHLAKDKDKLVRLMALSFSKSR